MFQKLLQTPLSTQCPLLLLNLINLKFRVSGCCNRCLVCNFLRSPRCKSQVYAMETKRLNALEDISENGLTQSEGFYSLEDM